MSKATKRTRASHHRHSAPTPEPHLTLVEIVEVTTTQKIEAASPETVPAAASAPHDGGAALDVDFVEAAAAEAIEAAEITEDARKEAMSASSPEEAEAAASIAAQAAEFARREAARFAHFGPAAGVPAPHEDPDDSDDEADEFEQAVADDLPEFGGLPPSGGGGAGGADPEEWRRRNFPGGPIPEFPIMTEELGYPPAPYGGGPGGSPGGGGGGRGGGSNGAVVVKALQDALGWKIKAGDASGFMGALTQSFQLRQVEGAVVSSWTPRSYVVQSDLSGGITGAQASIYTMAKTLLDQTQPLIDGLYPLDPASNMEDVAAIKDVVASQLNNLTTEIGYMGGPRVMRVHQYFQRLLGVTLRLDYAPKLTLDIEPNRAPQDSPLGRRYPAWKASAGNALPNYWTNPDTVLGSLGNLRDQLGLSQFRRPNYINTIADEQDATNFRIAVDYVNSLLSVWRSNIRYFAERSSRFLGTELVYISRQLGVVAETVNEVRFVLDSVFVGPAQRQTEQIVFNAIPAAMPTEVRNLAPAFLEDLLQWMQDFVGPEAQDVIQNAGKLGVGEDFCKMIRELYLQAYGLVLYAAFDPRASRGFRTARVQQSLVKLVFQLRDLYRKSRPVGRDYLPPRGSI